MEVAVLQAVIRGGVREVDEEVDDLLAAVGSGHLVHLRGRGGLVCGEGCAGVRAGGRTSSK